MSEDSDRPIRKRKGRALLVAAVGVAAVQFAACGPQPVGNLSAGDVGAAPDATDAPVRYDVVGNLDIGIAPDVTDTQDVSDGSTATDASDVSDATADANDASTDP